MVSGLWTDIGTSCPILRQSVAQTDGTVTVYGVWADIGIGILLAPPPRYFCLLDIYCLLFSENVESLWGPIPLSRLPAGVDNNCRAVTHG